MIALSIWSNLDCTEGHPPVPPDDHDQWIQQRLHLLPQTSIRSELEFFWPLFLFSVSLMNKRLLTGLHSVGTDDWLLAEITSAFSHRDGNKAVLIEHYSESFCTNDHPSLLTFEILSCLWLASTQPEACIVLQWGTMNICRWKWNGGSKSIL